jgi:hypothetical protein
MHAGNHNAPPMMTGLLAVYGPTVEHTTALLSPHVIPAPFRAAQVGCTANHLLAICGSLSKLVFWKLHQLTQIY